MSGNVDLNESQEECEVVGSNNVVVDERVDVVVDIDKEVNVVTNTGGSGLLECNVVGGDNVEPDEEVNVVVDAAEQDNVVVDVDEEVNVVEETNEFCEANNVVDIDDELCEANNVVDIDDEICEEECAAVETDEENEEWLENEDVVPEVEAVVEVEEVVVETPVIGAEDDSTDLPAPTKGMQFESALGFVTHLHRFGFANGFQVRIRDSAISKRAEVGTNLGYSARGRVHCLADEEHYSKYLKLTVECSKAGENKVCTVGKRRSHSCRTGCMFRVSASKSSLDGTWKIGKSVVEHNHELSMENSRFLANYRKISPVDQKIILENDRAGVKIGSNYQVFVVKYGGCAGVPFTERDLRNLLRADGRRLVAGGDFNAMEKHFCEMKQRSPDFYYEYDIDEKGILRNVFWADGRSRAAAKEFGDIVSFDSTYVTNRYRMPFSPFIAVNHHGNSLLLGCALITMEDAKSYEWVFKAWQRCMRRAPVGIITDQCKAIAKAVRTVFPDTKHRWCIWHIKRNLSKNMGMAANWVEINSEFRKLLSHMMTVSEFQDAWKAWGIKHGLESKQWFKELYKDRKRWVPVFFKNDFWAGMSSTQRSEGINHFFKGYVNSNTTLKVFLDQYGLAVEKRANEEDKLKFSNYHRTWSTSTKHVFEVVFQELFTSAKFLEIQEQIEMLNYANGTKISGNDDEVKYEVVMSKISSGVSRRRKFVVCLDKTTMDLKCECNNFEFKGVICTHAFNVMVLEGIDIVPEKFLYSRWRKDLPREYLKEKLPYNNIKGNETPAMKRYGEMAEACSRLCLSAMENEDVFKELMCEFGKLSLLVQGKTSSSTIVSSTLGGIGRVYGRKARVNSPEPGDTAEVPQNAGVKDPADRRGKGRTPLKRKGADLDKKISGAHKKRAGKTKCGETPVSQRTPEQTGVMSQDQGASRYHVPVNNQFVLDPRSCVQMQITPYHPPMPPTPFWFPPPFHPIPYPMSPSASSQPSTATERSKNQRSAGMLRMSE